jgi:hypothetical protein
MIDNEERWNPPSGQHRRKNSGPDMSSFDVHAGFPAEPDADEGSDRTYQKLDRYVVGNLFAEPPADAAAYRHPYENQPLHIFIASMRKRHGFFITAFL